MLSVMGLLEERERAVRQRVEALQAVLERRVVALAELSEVLAAGAVVEEPVRPEPVPVLVKEPVAASPTGRGGWGWWCTAPSTRSGSRLPPGSTPRLRGRCGRPFAMPGRSG